MSGSQKVLKVFSIFEVLIAAYYVYLGITGETITSFVSAALYLVAAFLLESRRMGRGVKASRMV